MNWSAGSRHSNNLHFQTTTMTKLLSLHDLTRLREETRRMMKMRLDTGTSIYIGAGTCGIAAGARETILAFEEELAKHNIKRGERILLKTGNSPKFWQTDTISKDFIYITRGAARFLVDTGVKLVGVDSLSVGSLDDPDQTTPDTHQILLGNETWIIEGLNLTGVSAGNYNLICLPLKLNETEGSPVRAIIQPIGKL